MEASPPSPLARPPPGVHGGAAASFRAASPGAAVLPAPHCPSGAGCSLGRLLPPGNFPKFLLGLEQRPTGVGWGWGGWRAMRGTYGVQGKYISRVSGDNTECKTGLWLQLGLFRASLKISVPNRREG